MYCKEGRIAISVKDTGIGIPPDKLDIIFDRFRQVDKSLTRKQEGSGIGLSIVKSLVGLHGGTVTVSSEYGKGTEFVIELPIIMLPEDNYVCKAIEGQSQERIERIHIEFSDIYSLS
jgi:two-component system CheB/CheR fusion protein